MAEAAFQMPDDSPEDRGLSFGTLYFCFFASGVAGLVYEVLWARYLALYLGSTGLAQLIVLGTFMGGLALGSQTLGKRVDRSPNPLKFYIFLELGIGAYALLFDRIFILGRTLFIGLVGVTGLSSGWLLAAKITACILTILLPTYLMGGTLPAMSRYMVRSLANVGPTISRLYFLNSIGAVVGCLLAGFYLIRAFGLQFSMVVGGSLNILVALVALVVLGRAQAGKQEGVPPEQDMGVASRMPSWVFSVILGSVALSGAVSMMYEVAWIRLLTLVLGSSTYSFSLMLATFILGLSLGGLLLSFWKRRGGYTLIFGLSEVAVGLTVLLTLPFYVRLPYVFNQLAASLAREPETFGLYQVVKCVLCGVVMLLPTIFQGITLPAATKVLTRDVRTLGQRVGYIFAVNTVGTLLGVAFAGFIGLPKLGIKGTLELAVVLNGLLGLAILFTVRGKRLRLRAFGGAVAASLLIWGGYLATMGQWDRDVLSAGIYRTRERVPSYARLLEEVNKRETVFYRDGIDATIAVQDIQDPAPERLLVINGKVDASTVGDLPTQKMIGHLPLLQHADPKKVLIVGVGSGATIGSVLAYDVEQVDVVELSRDVIDASRYFDSVNGRYWEDPRVRVFWEDAKTFLQVTDTDYDVIISEPTNPWIAGIAGVFSREYFEACSEHLAPGGLFVQWIQAYEMEDATFYLVLDTLTGVYPFYTLWNPTRSDVVLLASPTPYERNFPRMEERLILPPVREDLEPLGIRSVLTVLAMQMGDHAAVRADITWLGAVHSDFFPVLDYIAPRGFYVGSKADGAKLLDGRAKSPANARLWVQRYLDEHEVSGVELEETYRYALASAGLYEGLPAAWAQTWMARRDSDEARLAAQQVEQPSHGRTQLDERSQQVGSPEALLEDKLRCRRAYEDYIATRSFAGMPGEDALLGELGWFREHHPNLRDPNIYRWSGELQFDRGVYDEAFKFLVSAARILAEKGEGTTPVARDAAILACRAALASGDAESAAGAFRALLAGDENQLEVRLIAAEIAAAQ